MRRYPNKLNFDARYSVSYGVDEQLLFTAASAAACSNCQGQFPNDTTLFQRLDLTATYKFDPFWVNRWGFWGDIKAKLRYTWERNAVNNWQNDPLAAVHPDPAKLDLARLRQSELQCANDRRFAYRHLVAYGSASRFEA